MTDRQVREGLIHLYRIIDASEKGFLTAATNTPDLAQKILFRFYAQQRRMYKSEILSELQRLGLDQQPAQSLLGAIHRGRVAIMAGMAIKDSQKKAAIIREVTLGEGVAMHAYTKVLAQGLPPEIHDRISQQYAAIRDIIPKIRSSSTQEMPPEESDPADTSQPVRLLVHQGVTLEELDLIPVTGLAGYPGTGATLPEVVFSGAVGGAIWGGLMGVFAGIGVVWSTNPLGFAATALTWLWVMLGFATIGAVISSVLALFIGLSIAGEDRAQYAAAQEQVERQV